MLANVVIRLNLREISPKRLLLYLEWLALGMSTINSLLGLSQYPAIYFVNILVTLTLAGMRVSLPDPQAAWQQKLRFTSLEFFLIGIPFVWHRFISCNLLLLLVVVIRSYGMYKRQARLAVAGAAYGLYVVMMLFNHPPGLNKLIRMESTGVILRVYTSQELEKILLNDRVSSIFFFGLILIFVMLLISTFWAEHQNRQDLTMANERLRQFALRIEHQATLEERNRIAREIHDSIGHVLTAQSIQLENVQLFLHDDISKSEQFLERSRHLCIEALDSVRQSVIRLRSPLLTGRSLELKLIDLADSFCRTTGVAIDCQIAPALAPANEVATALYRIAQEALTNISKHSCATCVRLCLAFAQEVWILEVSDDGKGFQPDQNTSGFGLQGMRERANALGGSFVILSQPGLGCSILVRIPSSQRAYDSPIVG